MIRMPRSPGFWLACFVLWLGTLYLFSSFPRVNELSPSFNHSDKVAHFGYFFGGSGLLCAYLFRRKPAAAVQWKSLIASAVLCIAVIGVLDEFHQSFTPGRSGNDPYDWLADVLGGMVGALVFKRIHRLLE